ncbi:Aste57867_19743 [Aphanomyces stellatus]|uniref:Aste57867_19743 protein n=1 Tax=Aphanomyces stellatus TaxID=120398 RepID=A0A485LHW4_9STRA|nr:hypothetical protein As57867_019678 [Aphanomyces stellatus]VFT96441.1 Aste57867_19743 [Aphanomyces stellatus]
MTMSQVHATVTRDLSRPNSGQKEILRRIQFSRLSLLYSCFYVANIVTEPLKAYVSEPLPWLLRHVSLNTSSLSFDDYVNVTYSFLVSKYNTRTLAPDSVFSRDKDANTALLRSRMTLPSSSPDDCDAFVIHFPGSIFYGQGMVDFVCHFLAQNASAQLTAPQSICQHNKIAGLLFSDSCTWLDPIPNATAGTFWVYHAVQIEEFATWSWVKFGLRISLAIFIAMQVWTLYYCEYGPLLYNLRTKGLSNDDGGLYDIQIGDPTWLILSHPFICAAMVVDILYSTAYTAITGYRVGQVQDLWEFAIGSFSGSNMVWAAYAIMLFSTPLIKILRWEKYFAPVDPGIIALTAAIYAGPLFYLIIQTPIVLFFQLITQIGVPADAKGQSLDAITGMVFLFQMFASVPLINSICFQCAHRRRRIRLWRAPAAPTREGVAFASMRYNDWKYRGLYPGRKLTTAESGGTLYQLFDANPRLRKLPLFSCRGTDCFVRCVGEVTGQITHQYRLSLLSGLDVPMISLGDQCMATIESQRSTTGAVCVFVKPSSTLASSNKLTAPLALIPASSNCRWLL